MGPDFDPSKPFRIVAARVADGQVYCSISLPGAGTGPREFEIELLPPDYRSNRASLLTFINGATIPYIEVEKPEGDGIAIGSIPFATDPRFAMLWAMYHPDAESPIAEPDGAERAVPVPTEQEAREFWGAFDFAARWHWSKGYWAELCDMGYGPDAEIDMLPDRMALWTAAMVRKFGDLTPAG